MVTISQLPSEFDIVGAGGDPFAVTVDLDVTDGNNAPVTFSDPVAIVLGQADVPFDAGVPGVTLSGTQVLVSWNGTQTQALLDGARVYRWALQVEINSGNYSIIGGTLRMLEPTQAGVSTSETVTAVVKVGTVTANVSLVVAGGITGPTGPQGPPGEGGGGGGSGTVTTASVASANGFAGTVANATTTPAITVETTVTGVLKGNGTAVSAATPGTDYLTPSGSGSSLSGLTVGQVSGAQAGPLTGDGTTSGSTFTLGATGPGATGPIGDGTHVPVVTIDAKGRVTGLTSTAISAGGSGTVTTASVVSTNGFAGTVANASTTPAITVETTVTGILKGNGTAVSAASAGTDYLAPAGNGSSLTGLTVSQVSGAAPLASPTLTGTPAAPTATALDNSTKIATTAYADTAVGVETTRATAAEVAKLAKANNLSDIADAGSGRFNLSSPVLSAAACVATANVSLSTPGATIDGYTLQSNDEVLLTAQSTSSQNGIWIWSGASSALVRPNEFPTAGVVKRGRFCMIAAGTVFAGSMWLLTATAAGLTIDSSNQVWTALSITGSAANEAVIRANTLNQMAPPTGAILQTPQIFTSGGTWTPGANGAQLFACTIVGGGGGGNGGGSSTSGQGGGGAEVLPYFYLGNVTAPQTVTIGSGGAAGADGGSSSIGSLVTAAPGSHLFGIDGYGGAVAGTGGVGGAVASTSTGGGNGAPGLQRLGMGGGGGGGPTSGAGGGSGGSASIKGAGGTGATTGGGGGGAANAVAGQNGSSGVGGHGATASANTGAGGGGGGAGTSPGAGGAGGSGYCIIYQIS